MNEFSEMAANASRGGQVGQQKASAQSLVAIAESLSCLGELIEAIDGVRLELKRIADLAKAKEE